MIFVNDLWTLKDIPLWLEHTAAEADDMGLADTVFPAFLFIVGMSIPLSIQQRLQKGESRLNVGWHILERSFALLLMGLFLVNGEYLNEKATGINRGIWNIVCCSSFILLWNNWPRNVNTWLLRSLKLVAIIALAWLGWICRGGEGDPPHGFATYWWGILGLIGWAYLISALIYLVSKGNFYVAVLAWLLFIFTCIASHAGWIAPHSRLRFWIAPFGEGAMPAFTMGGAVITTILIHYREKRKEKLLFLVLAIIALGLFLAGFYTRSFWGISKIRATPAWVLICSAITISVFILIYWLADIRGRVKWFDIIKPAGTNTLLCYLLPYFAYALMGLAHLHLPAALLIGGVGLLKSFLFALLIILIAGFLGKKGLRLRL